MVEGIYTIWHTSTEPAVRVRGVELMREDANLGTALSAGTVGTRFWALVCNDEQWLGSELDGIVRGPAEHLHVAPRASVVATDRSGPGSGAGEQQDSGVRVWPWRTAAAPLRA
jgi:hypothetical protein